MMAPWSMKMCMMLRALAPIERRMAMSLVLFITIMI